MRRSWLAGGAVGGRVGRASTPRLARSAATTALRRGPLALGCRPLAARDPSRASLAAARARTRTRRVIGVTASTRSQCVWLQVAVRL